MFIVLSLSQSQFLTSNAMIAEIAPIFRMINPIGVRRNKKAAISTFILAIRLGKIISKGPIAAIIPTIVIIVI